MKTVIAEENSRKNFIHLLRELCCQEFPFSSAPASFGLALWCKLFLSVLFLSSAGKHSMKPLGERNESNTGNKKMGKKGRSERGKTCRSNFLARNFNVSHVQSKHSAWYLQFLKKFSRILSNKFLGNIFFWKLSILKWAWNDTWYFHLVPASVDDPKSLVSFSAGYFF